jgi:hypothetical protein
MDERACVLLYGSDCSGCRNGADQAHDHVMVQHRAKPRDLILAGGPRNIHRYNAARQKAQRI